ncbi:hypothetical protein C8Q80DRAFT_1131881 [Daedaleopsis nitida]|nr:hypothetical protein C8Q80DRAFT_1131881 [Daedaleopsis nitida]
MAATPTSSDPPYYVLISHSQSLAGSVPASSSLCHPIIEYHYADDPPASLLPQHPTEHVLVLDYESAQSGVAAPTVKSLSPDLIVSGLKVTDAPGAAVAGEPALRNNSIYVIETTIRSTAIPNGDDDEQPVHAVLSRFKQRSVVISNVCTSCRSSVHCALSPRNDVLRRILDYPQPILNGSSPDPHSTTSPLLTSPRT